MIYKLDSPDWSVFLQTGRKNKSMVQFAETILQTGHHFSINWILQTGFLQTGSIPFRCGKEQISLEEQINFFCF